MTHLKKLSWLALVVPVLLCCAAPFLVVGGAAAVAGVVGFAYSGLGLAAAAFVVVGGIAAVMVFRRRHPCAAAGCCDLPQRTETSTPENEKEQEPVLRP